MRVPFISLILTLRSDQAFITVTYSPFSLWYKVSAWAHSLWQALRALVEFHMVVVIGYIQQSFIYLALSYKQNSEKLKFTQMRKSFFFFLTFDSFTFYFVFWWKYIFLIYYALVLFLKQCIMSITISYC